MAAKHVSNSFLLNLSTDRETYCVNRAAGEGLAVLQTFWLRNTMDGTALLVPIPKNVRDLGSKDGHGLGGKKTYSFHAEPVMYPRTIASSGKTLSVRICMHRPRRAAFSEAVTTSGAAGGFRLTRWCFRPGTRESRTLNQCAFDGKFVLAQERVILENSGVGKHTGDLAQNGALVRNAVGENRIVRRDSVRHGHEERRVIDLVQLSHLAPNTNTLTPPPLPNPIPKKTKVHKEKGRTYTAT